MNTPSGHPVTLRITEIFHSLQGETSRAGLPTVFVRLTGCPLRCTWCDTTYSFTGGTRRSLDDVLAAIDVLGVINYLFIATTVYQL